MAIAIDMMNQYGVDSILRKNYFNNYGFNRNNLLYYCNLYSSSQNKKDTICFSSSIMWGFDRNDCCKHNMSDYVII